ncbi:hypothetical protein TGP89_356150 [Toxoplasma gondii p89]|uniref:Uncharacterized protein n=2 Tax=Toxoplasma gondii TaxID=5811 RepID=A0A2T6IU25_TOXGO|nr:hypothetical protein TGP89_356150 [Toxoplasma gondii p89]PUA88830.1 hypothetical protein TGBR9_356150 [Toxoplasma gondii TgCATBr9]
MRIGVWRYESVCCMRIWRKCLDALTGAARFFLAQDLDMFVRIHSTCLTRDCGCCLENALARFFCADRFLRLHAVSLKIAACMSLFSRGVSLRCMREFFYSAVLQRAARAVGAVQRRRASAGVCLKTSFSFREKRFFSRATSGRLASLVRRPRGAQLSSCQTQFPGAASDFSRRFELFTRKDSLERSEADWGLLLWTGPSVTHCCSVVE